MDRAKLYVLLGAEGKKRMPIRSYQFESVGRNVVPEPQTPREGYFNILRCVVCGHRDFVDGRDMNEYECDGCGEFVQIVCAD